MTLLDKLMLLFAAGTWGLFFVTKKNAAFGLAVGVSIFVLIFIFVSQ